MCKCFDKQPGETKVCCDSCEPSSGVCCIVTFQYIFFVFWALPYTCPLAVNNLICGIIMSCMLCDDKKLESRKCAITAYKVMMYIEIGIMSAGIILIAILGMIEIEFILSIPAPAAVLTLLILLRCWCLGCLEVW